MATAITVSKVTTGAGVHGGYELKETLKGYLGELGYTVIDCGTHSTGAVDYPDFALAVAQLVAQGRAWRGIIAKSSLANGRSGAKIPR